MSRTFGLPSLRISAVCVIALTAFVGAADVTSATTAPGARAAVLEGRQRALRGDAFELSLVVPQAHDLAGYQATIRFDRRLVTFGGARQRDLGLAVPGRAVESLGPVFQRDSVVVGAWSCGARNCVNRKALGRVAGASGRVEVARLWFYARRRVTADAVHLGSVVLTDTQGRDVTDGAAIEDVVGRPEGRSIDLTGDGLRTHADAMEAALGWQRALERRAGCGRIARSVDVTGNGCVSVTDVQRVSAGYSRPGAKRPDLPRPGAGGNNGVLPGGGSIVVNSSADDADSNLPDLVCATLGAVCTLRAAIQTANLAPGADTIAFNIPGAGVRTITLGSSLPALSDETGGTLIDGYTQPSAQANSASKGSNAQIRIQVTGTSAMDGITLTSASNEVRGLAVYAVFRKIFLTGPGARNNLIDGSFVGTNAAGSYSAPGYVDHANGIAFTLGASDNHIGTTTNAGRNIVSGNEHNAIWLWDEGTDRNVIINNVMGLAPDGGSARRNLGRGVDINAIASYTRVGGTDPAERNVISGNASEGIEFSHNPMTAENKAIGNWIGTDLTGEAAPAYAANGWAGIHFEDHVTENSAIDNVVVNSGCLNFSGGITLETRAEGNIVRGNRVGISPNGVSLPNCNWGIIIRQNAKRSTIGPGNVISNEPIGISIEGAETDYHTLTRNRIYGNAGLGIDLAPGGANANDANDADSGPNEGLNTPLLLSANQAEVTGMACVKCLVEIFIAQAGPSGYQGRTFVGDGTVDAYGTFTAPVNGVTTGDLVIGTTTDRDGNTSEYSGPLTVSNEAVPPANPAVIASDTFSRVVSGAWGTADQGGPWSTLLGGTTEYNVDGSSGRITNPAPGNSRGQALASVSAKNVDLALRVRTDRAPSGGSQYAYVVLRRSGSDEYRARLRYDTNGSVWLRSSRYVGGVETSLGATDVRITPTGSGWMWLRVQAVGSSPTNLRMKAWDGGNAEPLGWLAVTTDSSPTLQGPGAVGLRSFISGATTNAPVTFLYDTFTVTEPRISGSPPPPPPPSTDIAADAFERTVVDRWGRADVGGTWAVSTNVIDYDVNGGRALLMLTPGANRAAFLQAVSASDVDITVRLRSDVLVTGTGLFGYVIARRTGGGTEYRLKIRIASNRNVYVQASAVVRNAETGIGGEVRLTNVTHAAGGDIWIHAQVVGTSPTTLRMRGWSGGQTEPVTWQYTGSNSASALQAPGGIGLRAYLSGSNIGIIIVSFDDLRVTAP